jgi:glutamate/tyrosine decarboxylase-like PLP-dependent enzyme
LLDITPQLLHLHIVVFRNLSAQDEANRRVVDSDMAWDERQRQFYRDLQSRNARIYEVIHERSGRNSKELTVAKQEILEVSNSHS